VPDEEYFGPLLTVIRYDDFPEAIRQLVKLRRIAGDQPHGQAIAGLVGEANRLREVVVTDTTGTSR
jgi:acyl-CoA reductase-like NAD-dependent aldehyde dehydrogenase